MSDDRRRLIEVAFPLKQASVASVHEKNVRHGHISTLHIWPARRPLAACRAALLATLLPDPEDPVKRQELLKKIGGEVVKKHVKEVNEEGASVVEDKEIIEGGVLAWGEQDGPEMDEFRSMIRDFYDGKTPVILDPFAGGGAIPLEAMRLGCEVKVSDLNPVAWLVLKCTLEYPQEFSGKEWPIPEFVREWPDFVEGFLKGKFQRRTARTKPHFTDPRQLALTKLPEANLALQVRAWGRWVLEKARADLAGHYPVIQGEPTVAYLWARTARDKITTGRIPLLKTFWLCRKKGRRAALLPVPNQSGAGVNFRLLRDADMDHPERIISQHDFLLTWGITPENFSEFLNAGTMNSAGVWSPVSGRPGVIALTTEEVRLQGQQGLLGTQMTAVVIQRTKPGLKKTFKDYRLPGSEDLKATDIQIEELERAFETIPFGIPKEQIPTGSSRRGGGSAFTARLYGLSKWSDIFTSRQLLTLAVVAGHTRAAIQQLNQSDSALAEAVGAYLALALDRLADYNSQICNWDSNREYITHTFQRFALPIKWDFSEVNPFSGGTGDYEGALEWIYRYIEHAQLACSKAPAPKILSISAIKATWGNVDAIITDPPYYSAIPYSDLMDFFYIWLRRITSGLLPTLSPVFAQSVGPKWDPSTEDGELIDEPSRFGGDLNRSKAAYEQGMAKAFERCLDALGASGRLIVVFANKEVDAWESLIGALIKSGAVVTASWPVQTEMPNRSRGMASAALSSSVWIVCRKRDKTTIAGWEERVVERMKEILYSPRVELGDRNILQYYFDLGIRGPDFIWAALGPALEAYSAHPFVKKTAGGIMTVPEFLKEVRKLVLQFSLGELPGFRDVQQETQGRGAGLELDPITQYYLLHRAYFGLEPAPAGACILYANACGKNETELKVVWNILQQGGKSKRGRPRNDQSEEDLPNDESKGNEYTLVSWEERASRDGLGDVRGGQPAPLIDRLHRLMFLFDQSRTTEVQGLFDVWALANERAFKPLLQAVRELALRDKKDSERRLVEALATQLRMNRKTIKVADELKEVSLFEGGPGKSAAAMLAVGKE